ncbi:MULTISPECIES: SDR family oxidoreductase [unclassified Methylocaldum]|jgi:NAD(P)-dependent dehydrogenase (short-subunit alcohol dehydrogenase family)|uniref:SDR family oxidoreductase n=1 Tax=unclassified Methylocaldum TaxID=2622260 RepID=UPI000989A969|nr:MULTISPECIES: SDR family oxidoreductase [unclassified Methylocaldum]
MHNNKTILITGCSSGIGLCAARGLRQRGYRVFATARKESDVKQLCAEGFEAFRLDLADSRSIGLALEQVLRSTGGYLYAVFNNGAYGQPGAVEDLSREALREQFETNLFGTHELTALVLPVMRKQGYGRIIQNSSVLGFAAMAYRGAYNSSKYALEGLSDTLRLELAGTGIFVSLVEPGPIVSRFRDNALAMYKKNIDSARSVHREKYLAMESRLAKEGPAVPFTLGPEAVLKAVIHALEAKRPKARYYVTFPTYLFGFLKRILPDRSLDWVLRRAG